MCHVRNLIAILVIQDILDIETGSWTRVLPSGDPGSSGTETFPSPRQGAAAVTYTSGLVGNSRSSSTDTIVSYRVAMIIQHNTH
jgi:hypothetical protein